MRCLQNVISIHVNWHMDGESFIAGYFKGFFIIINTHVEII